MTDAPRNTRGLRRDLDLLEALASEEARHTGGLGVAQVSRLTGREKSQVSRSLRALDEAGLVERDADSLLYRLGWRLFSLAARATEGRMVTAAEPVLARLAVRTEETVHLCVLRDDAVLTVRSVSGHSFRTTGWEGLRAPLVCTSAGRVLLADATPDELHVRFGTPADLAPDHPRCRTRTVPQLWQVLREVADRGWAEVRDEFEPGVSGVSAPVRDFRGRVLAAINIAGPTTRIGEALGEHGRAVAAAAATVSAELGWAGPDRTKPDRTAPGRAPRRV